MSTAPSSFPPPSSGPAPELPEGVERPPPPGGTALDAVDGAGRLHRRLCGRARGAPPRHLRRPSPARAQRPHARGEHRGDGRAGPVAHRGGAPLRAASPAVRRPRTSACARWPAPRGRLDGGRLRRVLRLQRVVGRDPGRRHRRLQASRRARRRKTAPSRCSPSRCWSRRRADRRGVLLPGLLLHGRCASGTGCGRRRSSPAWSSAAIHAGSAEAAFLLPLVLLGFALCLLL